MSRFRDIPIKRKLTIISMLTCSVALLLACGAIIGFQLVNLRSNMLKEVLTTASMIGDNSAAALTFGDPASAELTLKSLDADEHLVAAFIYDAGGQSFARYQRVGAPPLEPPPVRRNSSHFNDNWHELLNDRFADDHLEVFRDISVAGEVIGSVYLRHDMTELSDELTRSCYLAFGIMVVAVFVAFVLSRLLLPLVAGPILNLGQIVREVAAHKDFSVRAVKQGDDEIGRLIDGFNEMLGEIQHRDSALQAAQDGLEIRVAARTQELAASLAVLNATLESTADGILAVERSGKVACYNSKFAGMWGIPQEMLDRRDQSEMAAFVALQLVHPEWLARKAGEQLETVAAEPFEVVELKDGRTFEHLVQSQMVEGECVGLVVNFRDITGRKLAETKLADASRQLLETSRRAGMAEVATSVLHNVGNVLNSVNVSCSVVADKVRKSRVGSVAKTAALLHGHQDDLAAFLTADPTGRKLPAYLGKLAGQLSSEQAEILRELKLLTRNIDHIKEIVAMQQNYAKVSGITESIMVADLVEDSLRMNEGSLANHSVSVIREFSDQARITVDKHKALQILVNLLRNAKHSCQHSGNADRRITVRVTAGGQFASISVIDNGVGIPPENLTQIFAHGFTTKADGHGFGLHSGALAAREMGGALTVHSGGTGQGATFTLELPYEILSPDGGNDDGRKA